MQNIVGRKIKEYRTKHSPKMTQSDLARELQLFGLNIDRSGVAKVEGGLRQISDIELVIFSKALQVRPADLLSEYDELNNSGGTN